VIRAFDGFDLRVDAIVGPGFSAELEEEVRDAAKDVSANVRIARNPDNLPDRMFEADFAVSTSSTTTYELLALGTPIVSVPVVDNQDPIATALRDRDAATVIEHGAGKDAFQRAIVEYLTDAALRRERRKQGRNLVDGMGTKRVVTAIGEVIDP